MRFAVVVVLHDSAGPLGALLALALACSRSRRSWWWSTRGRADDGAGAGSCRGRRGAGARCPTRASARPTTPGLERARGGGHGPAQPRLRAARRSRSNGSPAPPRREAGPPLGSAAARGRRGGPALRAPASRAASARCCPHSPTRPRLPARAARARRALPRRATPARSAGRSPRASRPARRSCGVSARSTRAQFLFFEDMDLCLRARAARIPTVLDPTVRVRHLGGHATRRAYAGEPHELLARRRREVVQGEPRPRRTARSTTRPRR